MFKRVPTFIRSSFSALPVVVDGVIQRHRDRLLRGRANGLSAQIDRERDNLLLGAHSIRVSSNATMFTLSRASGSEQSSAVQSGAERGKPAGAADKTLDNTGTVTVTARCKPSRRSAPLKIE